MSSCNWVGGAVADADRLRSAVPFEVVERLFSQFRVAVDAVHHLQGAVRTHLVAPGFQPFHELGCRLRQADAEKTVYGERGIPYPRIAIVPVPHAAHLLRQLVVGAAMMAPVGAYVSIFRTTPICGPFRAICRSRRDCAIQLRQYAVVSLNFSSAHSRPRFSAPCFPVRSDSVRIANGFLRAGPVPQPPPRSFR